MSAGLAQPLPPERLGLQFQEVFYENGHQDLDLHWVDLSVSYRGNLVAWRSIFPALYDPEHQMLNALTSMRVAVARRLVVTDALSVFAVRGLPFTRADINDRHELSQAHIDLPPDTTAGFFGKVIRASFDRMVQ